MSDFFSGSYDSQDVRFLLKPVHMEFVSVLEKERRIQSNLSHYSEMLSAEHLPSPRYIELFEQAMRRNASRFAQDIVRLAKSILLTMANRNCREITLVSLARAGTPVGVLLKRCLALLGWESRHYSISIIRDRGIDETALRYMLEQDGRQPQSMVFVDGWTGKGVIGAELKKSLADFKRHENVHIPDELFVVADLCGQADVSATYEDYLLPSSLLNSIISGLISRSVVNSQVVKPGDFHACVYHEHWHKEDISRWFVDAIFAEIQQQIAQHYSKKSSRQSKSPATRQDVQHRSREFLHRCCHEFGISDINYIKPGIGEATRVVLRREPHLVLIRDKNHADTQHLVALAEEKKVPMLFDIDLPYAAAAFIRTVK